MRQKILIFLFFITTQLYCETFPYKAFCHVPVADLFTTIPSAQHIALNNPWDEQFPPAFVYPRVSQLLFNEQVLVTEKRDNYAHVNVVNWFYMPHESDSKITDYWIKADTLTPLLQIPSTQQKSLPQPLSYKIQNLYNDKVVTLKFPYTINGITYSAGTRFTFSYYSKDKSKIHVPIYNDKIRNFTTRSIPTAYLQYTRLTLPQEKRNLFISLVKEWVSNQKEFFPYVLGGASIITPCTSTDTITSKIATVGNREKKFYYRSCNYSCPVGIDCSHLVARAAQIAQIPIFARNTATLLKTTKGLQTHESLQNGDLILWKGHVLIVSDVAHNLAIEARGYHNGYGKVHEVPLSVLFKNAPTYQKLLELYFNQNSKLNVQPLIGLNKAGNVVKRITDFKIVSLDSYLQQSS